MDDIPHYHPTYAHRRRASWKQRGLVPPLVGYVQACGHPCRCRCVGVTLSLAIHRGRRVGRTAHLLIEYVGFSVGSTHLTTVDQASRCWICSPSLYDTTNEPINGATCDHIACTPTRGTTMVVIIGERKRGDGGERGSKRAEAKEERWRW
jgi:hypothetical protein